MNEIRVFMSFSEPRCYPEIAAPELTTTYQSASTVAQRLIGLIRNANVVGGGEAISATLGWDCFGLVGPCNDFDAPLGLLLTGS